MDDILDDLEAIARRCERVVSAFEQEPFSSMIERLGDATIEVGLSSSKSWFDYHATLYLRGFTPATTRDIFDIERGLSPGSRTKGDWMPTSYEEVMAEIQSRSGVADLTPLEEAARAAREEFDRSRTELLPLLDALISEVQTGYLREARDKMLAIPLDSDISKLLNNIRPKYNIICVDEHIQQGLKPPHHLLFRCWLVAQQEYGSRIKELAGIARYVKRYLEVTHKMKRRSVAKTDGKITIGHGHSNEWRTLKEFIQDRLKLEVDEFNQSSPAGMTTKERLEQMLDDSRFAFLVLTAEDEHTDGTKHARENVIHECGLFQGRIGFRQAIILLENGCEGFSNIEGITQIRFAAGRMSEVFEKIRHVLEREGIIN